MWSTEISKMYNCSNDTIRRLLRKNNIKVKSTTEKLWNDQQVQDIIKMYIQNQTSTRNIAQKYECSKGTIEKLLKNNNIILRTTSETSRKYIFNEKYFEVIDNEEKAYWLGFIYADGFIVSHKNIYGEPNVGITLSTKDILHLEKFKNCLEATNPINIYYRCDNGKEQHLCRILFTSQKMVDDLYKLGVYEQKTFILKFPSNEQVPDKFIYHFIRGYFDGDGCITYSIPKNYSRRQYHISFLGTHEFLEGIDATLNIKNKFMKRWKNDTNNYTLACGGNLKVLVKLNLLYDNATIYLERKYNKYIELKQMYE